MNDRIIFNLYGTSIIMSIESSCTMNKNTKFFKEALDIQPSLHMHKHEEWGEQQWDEVYKDCSQIG